MAIIGYIAFGVLIALGSLLALAVIVQKRVGGSTGSWTPEHIAYNLMSAIAKGEGKSLGLSYASKGEPVDRKWLLDTFAECIQAVREPDKRLDKIKS